MATRGSQCARNQERQLITPKIVTDSINLPGKFHSDRLIVSTSRILGAELITYDKEIIRYSKAGYIKVFNSTK
ncbi:hypothetical protein ACQV5J_12815 [Leptospira interrogans]|uniref:hypothetical protein n=1 Tax=Leptospira interrogans TaxID=173 RepID=UPI000B1D0FFE|nr:hypothetical protein [Leptospira interrogans]